MGLVLTEDEILLRDSAEGFFADKAPVSVLRTLRDKNDEAGFDQSLWSQMGAMGFAGVLVGDAYGGVDMGFMAAGLLAEQMGTNLSATPFLSTSVLAATALQCAGSPEQKSTYLPKIARAKTIIALALDERGKHNPNQIETIAQKSGNGFKINGKKAMVIDGHVADMLIIAAKTSDNGVGLFLVDPKVNGLSIERTIMVDAHNAARIELDNVEVDGDDVLGSLDDNGATLSAVLNAGRAVISAEILGATSKAFEITLDYIKERKQFGKIIGEYQALQHRTAHLYCEVELARSCVLAALSALDQGAEDADTICSMAKAKLGDTAKRAALEGVQMHGGVGMTDEYDIGLFLKRIRVLQEVFGDGNFHANTVAIAKGF